MIGLISSLFFATAVAAMLAPTPQMGWNTWNAYKTDFDATDLKRTADLMVQSGLRDAGYKYLIVDEGWQAQSRDSTGRQQANATKFPEGISSLIEYVHTRKLKFGIYSDAGIYDCDFFPGSWGYEELDAQTYATWGVDYLKYDNCGGFASMVDAAEVRFSLMRDALLNSGRDIFYSLCEWGYQFPWFWADQIGQSYRMSGDITDVFSDLGSDCSCKTAYCLNTGYAGCSVLTIIRKMREVAPYQSPGSFADMDLLQIGNGDMTLAEKRTHMSFWAAMKSPLIIGSDITNMSAENLDVLKNKDIIAMNQDALGLSPLFVPALSVEHEKQIWAGPLSAGRVVVLVLNELNKTATIDVPFTLLPGLNGSASGSLMAREVWSGKHFAKVQNLNITLLAHDTQVFVVSKR